MSALTRTSRLLAGVGVLALTGAVVAAGSLLPDAELAQAEPLAVAVPPTPVTLVCSGPLAFAETGSSDIELGGASTVVSDAAAVVLARAGVVGAASLGSLTDTGTALTTGAAGAAIRLASPTAASVLRAEPTEQAAFAAAATAQRADAGDLRGLAASACPAPAATSWFAAGRTLVGDSAILMLRNAGTTTATITLRAWGALGPIALTTSPIVVPAGSESSVVLEAAAPDEDRLVVEVTSSGGQISATVATNQLTGLTPAGTDLAGPTTGPATTAIIPGVVLGSSTVDDADPSLVRVLNPGTEPVSVTLELLGPDGAIALNGPDDLVIEAGAVADVSLGGAPAGTYAVRVSADSPIVAGASLVRVGSPAPEDPDVPVVDRAWLSAVAPTGSAAVAVPGLGTVADRGVLVLADGSAAGEGDGAAGEAADTLEVTVTALDATGAELGTREVSVPAGGSFAVDLAEFGLATTAARIDSAHAVSSAVVLTYADPLGEVIGVVPAQADPQVERSASIRISLN